MNWIAEKPVKNKNYKARTRHLGELIDCRVEPPQAKNCRIIFSRPVIVAPGQSVVVYGREECLGGGIVS